MMLTLGDLVEKLFLEKVPLTMVPKNGLGLCERKLTILCFLLSHKVGKAQEGGAGLPVGNHSMAAMLVRDLRAGRAPRNMSQMRAEDFGDQFVCNQKD